MNNHRQSNKLITSYYTIEDTRPSTKSLLKKPIYASNSDLVTPSSITIKQFNQSLINTNNYLKQQSNNYLVNQSDADLLQPSQRLNVAEPTSPSSTNQLQLNLDLLENAMLIKCQPGFNGGLKQIFFLEIYDVIEQRLYLNITSVENPVFLLTELKPNTKFNLNIFAANNKGRSSSVNLNFHTFQPQISNAKKQGKIEKKNEIRKFFFNFLYVLILI